MPSVVFPARIWRPDARLDPLWGGEVAAELKKRSPFPWTDSGQLLIPKACWGTGGCGSERPIRAPDEEFFQVRHSLTERASARARFRGFAENFVIDDFQLFSAGILR